MSRARCPFCGARNVAVEVRSYKNTGPYAHAIFDPLKLDECTSCGTSWVHEAPLPAQLASYYGDAANYSAGGMESVAKDSWPIWSSRPAALITLARMLVEFEPGERFADLGPGNGAALSLAPLLLPTPQLGCIEYSARTIEFLRRHAPDITVTRSIDELIATWGEQSVTMLYSAHCFEHFGAKELTDSLAGFRRSLRSGGVLVIEVPFAPVGRVDATSRHTPHLIFFTPDGLRAMLNSHGFDVQLCFVGPGTTANSARWVSRRYPVPDPDVVGKRFADRIAVLNSRDFMSRDAVRLAERSASGVIKCLATRRET